ncbi:ClpP class periplasmic serine protease [Thermoplasmatales archaeon SCGC AB-540-F20]|nr:ClpP class periplasmic serine protease [Thermoplasmatales archaeon SCGC AB-540-F20]
MNRKERMKLIKKIEEQEKCKLIIYIAGDRRGMETKIATDIFPLFHQHLTKIGAQNKIDLFIYSTGGETIAGYGLVNLIREFCEKFNVIIPFKAYSCATLISLGANEILMTKMAQISPIDPSVSHPLGPAVEIPGQPGSKRIAPVSVEDVNAYVDLAKKEIGLKAEESMTKVFEILSANVNPLVLGAVQRSREQIAFLSKTLLKQHSKDDKNIENIVKTLTRERFSHNYLIGKKEAKDVLNLNIVEPKKELDNNIIALYNEYKKMTQLDIPYNPEVFLGQNTTKTGDFNRGIIESHNLTHLFRTKKEVKRVTVQQKGMPIPVMGHQERILQQEWIEDNSI